MTEPVLAIKATDLAKRYGPPDSGQLAVDFPMMFLGGVFVPVASLPPGLRVVARLLPLTYAAPAARAIDYNELRKERICTLQC